MRIKALLSTQRRLQRGAAKDRLQSKYATIQGKLDAEKERSKSLENQLKNLEVYMKGLEKSKKLTFPKGGIFHGGDYYIRVAMPDFHGQHHDPAAIGAFLNDLSKLRMDKSCHFIILGDAIDCGGWLSAHHTLGYVEQVDEGPYSNDISATNQILDEIDDRIGAANKYYIEGNHEQRVEKTLVQIMGGSKKDIEFFLDHMAPEKALKLEHRGYKYYKRSGFYNGLLIPGTIRIGDCHYTHGTIAPSNSANAYAKQFGGNVVFGHVHRMDSWVTRSVSVGNYGAWTPGCLCKLQPRYMHTNLTTWSHGYNLQIVNKNEKFLSINVPIINGESYLFPLIDVLKGAK